MATVGDGDERMIYLYGVVPEDAPDAPAELRGLEGGAVRVVRVGGVGGIVSEVPAAQYADEPLNARLGDLAWVGQRGVAHEAVLTWFADRGPVVPLSPFSLHRDEQRVRERLRSGGAEFGALLHRFRGRQEWGVKLWRVDPVVAEHLEQLSPSLRALGDAIREAPPGKRFLLEKKRQGMQAEEIRTASARVSQQVFAALREHAERARALALPPRPPEGVRALALHAAFLVAETEFQPFRDALNAQAERFQPMGFEFEFTGPWPPYHFVDEDDD